MHQTAVYLGADSIIARNGKDLEKSSVPVLTPVEFFAFLADHERPSYDKIPF
ncbi:hypothetical protein [Curtanaerobium respiraculi]|uniref:hypothetical protein n=1 Tax=Curtanaerobium respiraculi TaxID=2949669 RepID=UPI0024B325B9|nr:hypothetical protein [Curtanaerobium respiraculi]